MKRALLTITISAMLTLTSCKGNDEQAIRHLVLAELIQREHVSESHIEVQSVRFLSRQEAIATAKVLGQGGRADTWRHVECRLTRAGGHWTIQAGSAKLE